MESRNLDPLQLRNPAARVGGGADSGLGTGEPFIRLLSHHTERFAKRSARHYLLLWNGLQGKCKGMADQVMVSSLMAMARARTGARARAGTAVAHGFRVGNAAPGFAPIFVWIPHGHACPVLGPPYTAQPRINHFPLALLQVPVHI
jgi:hypothetical protein